jgi:hypothetical protein
MIKDIENPKEEFENLTKRFKLLHDRFLAIAMDYKHYIDPTMNDHEVFKLRDNVLYRLYSARFHFQLLLEYHHRVENRLKELYNKNPKELFQGGFEIMNIQEQSTKEIYSLFDSMIYHLCSIFDYLFRLINFSHSKTIVNNPKWNLFQTDKNLKNYIYCSKELIPKLKEFDDKFVYPLIKHRSHLIHTENDTGEFKLTFNLGGDNFNAKFQATSLLKNNFPELMQEHTDKDFTIKYASVWLIGKAIQTTTEILFELRDDMQRNQKVPHGMFVLLGPNNTIQPASTPYWGQRENN